MNSSGWLQLALYVAALALITKPMGLYLMRVLDAEGKTWLDPVIRPVERLSYWVMGVRPEQEQNWRQYTWAMLLFSLVSCVFTYAILRLQNFLPLNPQGFGALSPDLAFNTAVSFTTNTNWQSYGGESTMSYLSQMVALVIHNFASAATRHRHRGRAGARYRAAFDKPARQLLGGSGARHLLFTRADLPDFCGRAGVARHDSKLQALHHGEARGILTPSRFRKPTTKASP